MGEDVIRRLANEQRKRLIAGVMHHAEAAFFDQLTPQQRKDFRDKVLASANSYHDFILDVLKVGREEAVQNEHSMALIRQVHESQRRLERAFEVAE